MTTSTSRPISERVRPVAARIGYGVTILVDLILLWIVANILEWELAPFLTDEFSRVSSLIMFSLVASLVVNASLMVTDRPRSGILEKAVLALINLWVTVEVLRVFPFDFTGSDFNWAIGVRALLVLAIVGTLAEFVTGLVRLARSQSR